MKVPHAFLVSLIYQICKGRSKAIRQLFISGFQGIDGIHHQERRPNDFVVMDDQMLGHDGCSGVDCVDESVPFRVGCCDRSSCGG